MSIKSWNVRALWLLALLGCSEDDGARPIAVADFCDAYAEQFCEGVAECCGEQAPIAGSGACFEQQRSYCRTELLTLDDLGLAPTGPNVPARIVFDFDEQGAGEALARMRSVFLRCDGEPYVRFGELHFLGEPGAECLEHSDCVEGTRCEHPPLAVFGTCTLAPLAGQACVDVCGGDELFCTRDDNGDRICAALRKEGESCDELDCAPGLQCIASPLDTINGATEYVCMRFKGEGESCDVDTECQSSYCRLGRCADDASALDQFCFDLGYLPEPGLSGLVAP